MTENDSQKKKLYWSPKKSGGSSKKNNGQNNKTKQDKPKKGVTDYVYYLGSAKQASDYQVTTAFLINHVRKTYDHPDDIGQVLEELSEIDTDAWKPTLKGSTKTDADEKKLEEEQFRMEFKEDFSEYKRRLRAYQTNKTKAYAFLWERCAKGMQSKIESRSDYDGIKNDPVKLLKAIKEHALNYQENRYDMSIVLDSIRAMINLKQKDNEFLQDYTKRFRTAKEVMESHIGGPLNLAKLSVKAITKKEAETGISLSATEAQKIRKEVHERFCAYVYFDNADPQKYGSLKETLITQKSLGNNQYPDTITTVSNALSEHKHDNRNVKPKSNKKETNKTKNSEDPELKLAFAQLKGKCYCCGSEDHMSWQCSEKGKPKDQWAINMMNAKDSKADNKKTEEEEDKTVSWQGVHYAFTNAKEAKEIANMRILILLDNQSSVSVFCYRQYVKNIRYVKEVLRLVTNGGVLIVNQKADLPNYGEVWFCEDSMTNILSFAEVSKKHKITYDSEKNDGAFLVHMDKKVLKFCETKNNLYVFNPMNKGEDGALSAGVQMVNTVDENRHYYTQRQFDKALLARALHHALGAPSASDLKAIITMNLIKNNPVTVEDVNIAEKIFGPDVATIKGKATRLKPDPVAKDMIHVPEELYGAQREVTLCIDAMKVNGLWFLTTISRRLYYRTAQPIPKKGNISMYCNALKGVVLLYNKGGFRVEWIHADNEFRPLEDELLQKFQISMNFASAQEHVPEAERNNRVLKERTRVVYHRLAFNRLPKKLVETMVMESARKLNYFPARHGISRYYSPRMLLHQQNLSYEKDCTYVLGEYVIGINDDDPKNDNKARGLDCLYLRPANKLQGGHDLLHLPTNKIVTRNKVIRAKITPAVIARVHAIAVQEGMPDGLKIESRDGSILYDAAWIAGVDYEENNEESSISDDEEVPEDQESEDEDDESDSEDEDDEDPSDRVDENIVNESAGKDTHEHNPSNVEENAEEQEENSEEEQEEPSENNQDQEPMVETVEEDVEEDEDVEEENDQTGNDEETSDNAEQDSGRPVRSRKPPKLWKTDEYYHMHLQAQTIEPEHYASEDARVIASVMCLLNMKLTNPREKMGHQFIQTYSLKAGLKKFGEKGREATTNEMKQIHDRVVFKPIRVEELTQLERAGALASLLFLVEKRDGRIKSRFCANGSTQRTYIDRDESSSPTVFMESILLTGLIAAYEGRDVMTADIPNAFVQTELNKLDKGERVVMKIQGVLVDILCEIDSETYSPYVVYEKKGIKTLYVMMLKALYGMLVSSLLYYKKFRKDIEEIGYIVNPYDPCVANKKIDGLQHTVAWFVDDLKASHKKSLVNDRFYEWLNKKYGSVGEVKAHRGKRHDYLAMFLDFSEPKVLLVDMVYYIEGMVVDFPYPLAKGEVTCPWTEKWFQVDENAKALDTKRKEVFHTFVMKGMFVGKRARQDIQPGISFLATRIQESNEQDWKKLCRLLRYLRTTKDLVLRLEADGSGNIYWWVDASFAVHPDYKSHTGAVMSLGKGCITSISTKQKVNTRSTTESELVGLDDVLSKILWSKYFLEWQEFPVNFNLVGRDNTSSMKLEENGRASASKRTRHFNIKYFYATDLIERGEILIEYCPTEEMRADYMTKFLVGINFINERDWLLNIKERTHLSAGQQECVGIND